jgi:hypothetical protein
MGIPPFKRIIPSPEFSERQIFLLPSPAFLNPAPVFEGLPQAMP